MQLQQRTLQQRPSATTWRDVFPRSLPQNPDNPPPRPWLHNEDDCHYLANTVDQYAKNAWTTTVFVNALRNRFIPPSNQDSPAMREFRSSGFKPEFNDDNGSYNQVRHFVGGFFPALSWLQRQVLQKVRLHIMPTD